MNESHTPDETTPGEEAGVPLDTPRSLEMGPEELPAEGVAPSPGVGEPPAAEMEPTAEDRAEADAGDAIDGPAIGSGADGIPDDASLIPLEEIAPAIVAASLSRRAFLGFGLALAGGLAGAGILARLFPIFSDGGEGVAPIVPAYDPVGKRWTFVVDTASCIGCGLCVAACKEENHVPEDPKLNRTWIERHVTTADGTLYVDSPDGGINGFPPGSVAPGAAGKPVQASFFSPRLCMQCEDSPCTQVCPVGATYHTADGVILVDARRCIGCGYCVVACPYGARYLVPAGGEEPSGVAGVADKCTWCYHRISRGLVPACVEVCPVGARKFGDAADPKSEIAAIVRDRHPLPLHPEYGTRPRVLYLGPVLAED